MFQEGGPANSVISYMVNSVTHFPFHSFLEGQRLHASPHFILRVEVTLSSISQIRKPRYTAVPNLSKVTQVGNRI